VIGEGVACMLKVLRRLQQRLGGNAADIGTGATGRGPSLGVFPVIDTRRGEPQLRCTDRCNIAAGSAPDDDHVKFFCHEIFPQEVSKAVSSDTARHYRSSNRRAGSSRASFIATRPSTASRPSMMRWS